MLPDQFLHSVHRFYFESLAEEHFFGRQYTEAVEMIEKVGVLHILHILHSLHILHTLVIFRSGEGHVPRAQLGTKAHICCYTQVEILLTFKIN